jgi:hypothetical protein
MTPWPRLRVALAAGALVLIAAPAFAAPIRDPKPGPLGTLTKYLPDDTDGFMVIRVKEIVASPFFTKNFKAQFEKLVAADAVKAVLKETEINPLKDVDLIGVVLARSCYPEDTARNNDSGPTFLFQGKFNSVKIRAKMDKLAKDSKDLKIEETAGGKIYAFKPAGRNVLGLSGYAAVLDGSTLILSPQKAHVADAVAKAAGKKTMKFKYPGLTAQLKTLKAGLSIQGVALEQMYCGGSGSATTDPAGNTTYKMTHRSLADEGFKSATLSITVKDSIKGTVALIAKNKDEAKTKAKKFNEALEQSKAQFDKIKEAMPEMKPLFQFSESIKIKAAGDKVVMEGEAAADVIQAYIDLIAKEFARRPINK